MGTFIDASNNAHGFVFDGSTYTTLNDPFGGISARGISGNTIVGAYTDAKNRTHGFVYDGATWTTLDDPLFRASGITALYGIDGGKIVGNTLTGTVAGAAFLYDGATFNHPFGIEGLLMGLHHQFFGISGNRIVGEYNDKPFVYIIPEPATYLLAALGGLSLLAICQRQRNRTSPQP
ncbi:MAG: hypothetical protein K2Y37_21200 [Pirellulales bacterium]|nr:hypothetical protein [Pirellulales bacterium]